MRTNRFGIPVIDEDESSEEQEKLTSSCHMRHIILSFISFIMLFMILNQLPIFRYDLFMPFESQEAQIICKNLDIITNTGINEGIFFYGDKELTKIHLYATNIKRSIECYYYYPLEDEEKNKEKKKFIFVYEDDYFNISGVDIDNIIKELTIKYVKEDRFTAWYYKGYCYLVREEVDRNCISSHVIDREKFYNSLDYVSIKVTCLLMSFSCIGIITYFIHVNRKRYYCRYFLYLILVLSRICSRKENKSISFV